MIDRHPSDECSLCGDVALPAVILALDPATGSATARIGASTGAVLVDLLENPQVGDAVLVHAGVAIARIAGEPGEYGP